MTSNDDISPMSTGVSTPMVDAATSRRLSLADKSYQEQQQQRAVAEFLAGEKPAVPGSPKSKRRAAKREVVEDDVGRLASFLVGRQQRVLVEVGGVEVGLKACVHVDMASGHLTMVTWGDDATSLRLNTEGTAAVLNLEDHRTFHVLFLGLQMRLGLHGMLIGFNLVDNG